MAARMMPPGGQHLTDEQVYRDFIHCPPDGGAIKVYGTPSDHTILATYVNLGHKRQYTPSYDQLNGLYALEVSLQAICVRLQLPTPDFDSLRTLYYSNAYKEEVNQILGELPDSMHSEQIRWNLTQAVNLTRDALRLVLVLFAKQINARLRLGVLYWDNDLEGRVWRAVTYPEMKSSQVNTPNPYTVWVVDDAGFGDVNPERAPLHWSGLGPKPLYALPVPASIPQTYDVPPQVPYPWQGYVQPEMSRRHRLVNEASHHRLDTVENEVGPADLSKSRTEYPSHLTEEEVINKYPERLSMETLLYVLRRYRQTELLEQLEKRKIKINSETLRQRKKAALDNRARNRYGFEEAKRRYKDVSREYDEEVRRAGWYEPRAERGTKKRKSNNRQDDGDNGDEEVNQTQPRKRLRFEGIDSAKAHPGPGYVPATMGTIDPKDTMAASLSTSRPFSRNRSTRRTIAPREVQQAPVSENPYAEPRSSALRNTNPMPRGAIAINIQSPGTTPTGESDTFTQPTWPNDQALADDSWTDEQFAALLDDCNAVVHAAAADNAAAMNNTTASSSEVQLAPKRL